MSDEFDRAQDLEEKERQIALQEHQRRTQTTARPDCADCSCELAPHRQPYGTCIECQTDREKKARLYRKD